MDAIHIYHRTRKYWIGDINNHPTSLKLSSRTPLHIQNPPTMPRPTKSTAGEMVRDGFASDCEPVEGTLKEIREQDQELCQRYGFPLQRADYQYCYIARPPSAAAPTSPLSSPVEHKNKARRWGNRILRWLGLASHKQPKQGTGRDESNEGMGDPDVKYECVARSTPTQSVKRAWLSGQTRSPPGPDVVENRFVVEIYGDRRPPNEREMRVWREYAEDCKERGEKPGSSVPVQGRTLRKMF